MLCRNRSPDSPMVVAVISFFAQSHLQMVYLYSQFSHTVRRSVATGPRDSGAVPAPFQEATVWLADVGSEHQACALRPGVDHAAHVCVHR